MRVVMLSKALVVGAYQRKLEELAKLPGVTLTVIVPPAWRDRRGSVALSRTHVRGYELIAAPVVFNGQYHLHFYPTLGRILNDLRPDILHVDEEPYNLATWHALRIGEQLGATGTFFTWQNLQRRYPLPFRLLERANYQRAGHAIAGNQAAQRVLRAKGYRGPVTVIPQFGVDPEIFSPPPATPSFQQAGGTPRRPFTIGYAGGLVPEKGIETLVRACADLPAPDWRLRLLGDGPEKGRLQQLAGEMGLTDRIVFEARLPSTEMPGFYRSLDLLVLPSRSRPNWIEQFGRVLIEAMACGVPVIGSDSGEIPHVIGDAGLIFPEGDVRALGEAIASLARDSARRVALAARGRARILAHFTQAQIAAATYDVYRSMYVGPNNQSPLSQ